MIRYSQCMDCVCADALKSLHILTTNTNTNTVVYRLHSPFYVSIPFSIRIIWCQWAKIKFSTCAMIQMHVTIWFETILFLFDVLKDFCCFINSNWNKASEFLYFTRIAKLQIFWVFSQQLGIFNGFLCNLITFYVEINVQLHFGLQFIVLIKLLTPKNYFLNWINYAIFRANWVAYAFYICIKKLQNLLFSRKKNSHYSNPQSALKHL